MPLDSALGTVDYQSYQDLGNNQTAKRFVRADVQSGEDLANDVQKTEERGVYAVISTATTTVINAKFIYSARVLGGTLGNVTGYDNTAASGSTPIPTVTPTQGQVLAQNIVVNTGFTIVTAAATFILISYR